MTRATVILIAALVAVVGYVLPWVVNPGAGLTLGAYDLAEWASLHPEQRPTLLASLLLRLPLLCLTLVVAFSAPRFNTVGWWVATGVTGLLILTALPPLEFFIEARGDINYRQQFALTVVAFLGAALGLRGWLPRLRPYIAAFSAITAIISGFVGLLEARQLMIGFSMPVAIGWGIALLVLGGFVAVLGSLRKGSAS